MSGPWSNQSIDLIVLTEETTGFSGLFGYSPTVGGGNLIFSLAAAAGTDPYGNAYPQGLSTTLGSISGTTITAGDTIINMDGIFTYSPSPGAGNLVASQAPADGTDAYGNAYLAGTANYDADGAAVSVDAADINWWSAGSEAGPWTQVSTISGSGELAPGNTPVVYITSSNLIFSWASNAMPFPAPSVSTADGIAIVQALTDVGIFV